MMARKLALWIKYVFCVFFIHQCTAIEIDLKAYENSLYSPNGEDGVFARIFAAIKPVSRFCVECGAYDGITNSMTYLLRNQGWRALLLDRSYDIPNLSLHKEFITSENVNRIFEKYGVPSHFDLLTLDTGYNDFYIWNALDARYQPSVVCIAYNAFHKPEEDKVVLYYPFFCGDDTNYFGASMLALYHLGKAKGYALIYAEETGRHLFFVREDLIESNQISFKNVDDVKALYRPAVYEIGRQDAKQRKYISSEEVMKR